MGTDKHFLPKTKYIVEWKDFNFLEQGMHSPPHHLHIKVVKALQSLFTIVLSDVALSL